MNGLVVRVGDHHGVGLILPPVSRPASTEELASVVALPGARLLAGRDTTPRAGAAVSRRTGFICDPLHPVVRAGRRCTLVGTAAVAGLATHALADPIADATLAPATCVRLPREAVVSAALPLWILTLSRLDASALTWITDAVGAGAPLKASGALRAAIKLPVTLSVAALATPCQVTTYRLRRAHRRRIDAVTGEADELVRTSLVGILTA